MAKKTTKKEPKVANNLNKADFISYAQIQCERNGTKLTKVELGHAYDAIMQVAKERVLAFDNVTLHGLLTLKPSIKPASTGRNPGTGDTIQIPERAQVKAVLNANFKLDVRDIEI